ncbi:group I truncated hemoglobin [Nonomuraea lactucae]|uniref:group I truncated hemoglobin n=1 Tax=Nonomuraea lactucae TaxID=2249762 RepID=UPI000DE4CE67|nr:group 1 truncated hemoglobin [Nonomuraea lactucae]
MVALASHYESIGGNPAVREVVEHFYAAVLDDAELKPYFDGVDLVRLKRHMVMLLCSVLGGPDGYKGRDLADAHRGVGVTGEHYEKVGGVLVATLRDHGAGEEIVGHVVTALGEVRGAVVERPAEAAG